MATNKALQFIKTRHYNGSELSTNWTTNLAKEGALIYATDSHELWIGGAAPVCVVKGTTNVDYNSTSKQLTITASNASGAETTKTLDFKDVASADAVFAVFRQVYDIIGTTASSGNPTISYNGTHYLVDLGTEGEPAKNLVNADKLLDSKIYDLEQAVGGDSVVNELGGQHGVIGVGNGLEVTVSGNTKTLNLVPESNGYIVTSQNSATGINIDSTKVDSAYTTANATNLATVATVTSALNSLDVTEYAQASVANDNLSFTIKGIKEDDGKIAAGTTAANDLTLEFEDAYNASSSKIATKTTVTSAINALDVDEYDQASVDVDTTNHVSTLKIKGIKEVDGKIAASTTTPTVDVAIDGEYNASTNKIATQSTVTNAINALDVPASGEGAITGMGAGKTIATLTETDGKIAATFQDISITSSQISDASTAFEAKFTDGSHNVVTISDAESGVTTYAKKIEFFDGTQTNGALGTASTASDTLYLKSTVTDTNPIITESDLSGIVGAMVYKGIVDGTTNVLPISNIQAGWTYVVSVAGTYAGQACEVGDMIIAKTTKSTGVTNSDWNVINGENQVTNAGATITAGAGSATTIATVDGTDITAQVSVTAGSATIASKTGNVVTIKTGVTQTGTSGTIGNDSGTDIVLDDVAVTGAAADVSIADTGGLIEATTVEGALAEIATEIDAMDVTGYAQATIAAASGETPTTSVLTIKGISETDGKIAADTTNNLDVNVDGVYNASTNMIATKSTVTNAINALDATVDADVATASGTTVATTATTPDADFKVLNSVTETDGKLSAGTAYNVKKLAATAEAADLTVTSANYGGSTPTTNAQTALNNLASAISSAAITIDGQVGAITTGNGITTLTSSSKVININLDSSNANGLSVGNAGLAMAKATDSTFGTVEVTSGNGLTLTDGVVAYAHNTSAITVASKDTSTNVITINGTLTPDASDAITTSNAISLAAVAATGEANNLTVTSGNYGGSSATTNAQTALSNLANAIDGMDVTEFALAEKDSSTNVVTIHGISETDGKIAVGVAAANDVVLASVAATGNASDVATAAFTVGPAGQGTQTEIPASNVQAMIQSIETRLYWDIYE